MSERYKAALLTGPEQIEIGELERPEPGPGEALVRIRRANLCPTDLKKYYRLDEKSAGLLSAGSPVVLGHEAAGVVAALGAGVMGVEVGARVAIDPMLPCGKCVYCKAGDFPMCQNLAGIGVSAGSVAGAIDRLEQHGVGGTFAEYVKVPAENLYPLPDSLSFEAAALMEPLADVIHSLEAGNPQPGEVAVVFGLGAMGLMHIRVMAHRGVQTIVGVDPLEARRQKAAAFGASLTIDPTEQDPVEVLKGLGGGVGPHVIFVCAGGEAQKLTTKQALAAIRKKGRVLLYASAVKPPTIEVDINHIHYGMIVLTGTVGFYRRHAEEALDLLAQGVVDADAIRRPTFPLDDIEKAFALYGTPDVVKVGIDIDGA